MSTIPNKKRIAIIGGGTNTYISNHLALSAPAYGTTAVQLEEIFKQHPENKMEVDLYLTKMADPSKLTNPNAPDTPEDVEVLVDKLVADPDTRVIIFNVAMVDFKPELGTLQFKDQPSASFNEFGKYNQRLPSRVESLELILTPYQKIINKIRKERKDILLVGFKTTCGATKAEQFNKGLKLCKDASANIVFVNDVNKERIEKLEEGLNILDRLNIQKTYTDLDINFKNLEKQIKEFSKDISELQNNGLVTPEESSYWYNTRDEALDALVQMVLDRSHLHFTRSTVVDSETVPWSFGYTSKSIPVESKNFHITSLPVLIPIPNPIIPESFRAIFNWVRFNGAYKQGPTGSTVGHMGIKLGPNEFLTTKRKTDFNKMEEVGLVRVITDDPDDVFGYKHFFKSELELKILNFISMVLSYTDNEVIDLTYFNSSEDFNLLVDFSKNIINLKSCPRSVLKELIYKINNKVIAFGAKPSVGGQSQRSLFDAFPDLDCIVHFHCPLKSESRELFKPVQQFSFECGSSGCIENNLSSFHEFKVSNTHSIWAGHMDYHGPNIVFNSDIDPQLVIGFINTHWELSRKTDGLSKDNK